MGDYRVLINACLDLLRANCRAHRERATARIRGALEDLSETGSSGRSLLFELASDMARFIDENDDDPLAQPLLERARTLGLLRR